MGPTQRWSEFTRGQQKAIFVTAAMELILTTTAMTDLARRPSAEVRGPKALWALGCFVQPAGPIAYLALGRRTR